LLCRMISVVDDGFHGLVAVLIRGGYGFLMFNGFYPIVDFVHIQKMSRRIPTFVSSRVATSMPFSRSASALTA
jgi:hypothetical protein